MRSKIKRIFICLVGILLFNNVFAICDSCEYINNAFQICDMSSGQPDACYTAIYKNSLPITLEDYNGTFFSIRDNVVYLNNSNVSINIYEDNINKGQPLTFNITGNNVIKELNSIAYSAFGCNNGIDCLKDKYTYQPISVIGNGLLEIEKVNILKRDLDDNQYYKCWTYSLNFRESKRGNTSQSCITKLERINDRELLYNLYVPEDGFRLSDLQDITYNDADVRRGIDSLFYGVPGTTMNYSDLEVLYADSNPRWMSDIPELYSLNDTILPIEYNADEYRIPSYRVELISRFINSGIIVAKEPTTILEQITQDWGNKNIQTELPRSFTKTGSYLIGTKQDESTNNLDTVTVTQSDNIVFESTVAFDSNYHLSVDDITEDITDEQASREAAKTDKILVKLYDINMLDKDNKIVPMENGTYTIKIKLSDLLKKYNDYQVIYIDDDNKVELINAKEDGDYIVFNTTHLSKYGIVGLERTTKKLIDLNNQEIKNPKTADNMLTYGLVFFTLIVASITTIIRIKNIEKVEN